MKNTIILTAIAIATVFTSCGNSPEDIASEHIRKSLKNPESFQLDSIKMTDTLTVYDIEMAKAGAIVDRYEDESEKLSDMMGYNYLYSLEDKYAQLDTAKKYGEIAKVELSKAESIKGTAKDTVIAYGYDVFYMGTNSFNAKVKENSRVYVNKANQVVEPTSFL